MLVEFKGNDLVITIKGAKKPLKKLPKSKSGKTFQLASSGGFKETELELEGKPVFINLNASIYVEDKITSDID